MKKFVAIEGLRGWMAWWVVLGHAVDIAGMGKILHPIITKAFSESFMAVQVFMIISGFVITHLMKAKNEDYGTYLVNRWFRLMPLMILMLSLVILTRNLYHAAWIDNPWVDGDSSRIARIDSENKFSVVHIILHLTLLQGVIPDNILPFSSSAYLAPAWSLSLEWQFYLLAPFMVYSSKSIKNCWINIILISLSIPTLLGAFGYWSGSYPFILQNLPFFFIGIASRQVLDGRIPVVSLMALFTSVAVFIFIRGMNQIPLLFIVSAIWGVFMLLTLQEADLFIPKSRWLNWLGRIVAYNPVISEMGRVSYSTYLSHVPILSIIIGAGMLLTGRSDHPFVVELCALSLIVTIPVSALLYRLVEQPGAQIGKWLLSNQFRAGLKGVP